MPVTKSRSRPSMPNARATGRIVPRQASRASGHVGKAKRPRRKDPLWARLLLIFGALLMVGSGGTIVSGNVLINHVNSSIQQDDLLGTAGQAGGEGDSSLDGPINLLLLGIDARVRNEGKDLIRADTIIILHIPASHDQAYLLSIPRDTEARIPPFEKTGYRGGTEKINAAFAHGSKNGGGWAGGAQLMAQTINKMTGITFSGAAIINFGGFKKIIDALGGVHVCVDEEVKSIHMVWADGKPMYKHEAKNIRGPKPPVVHKKGCRNMAGWEALDYSRQRYGLSKTDYSRQQNQQKVIKAMATKAMDAGVLTNPLKINELIKAAGEALLVDTRGVRIEEFVFALRNIAAKDLVMLRANGGDYNGVKVGDEERERLDETTLAMFRAVRDDALAEFIVNNPSVLVPKSK